MLIARTNRSFAVDFFAFLVGDGVGLRMKDGSQWSNVVRALRGQLTLLHDSM